MSEELYKFLPTELVWEIEKQLRYSYKRDVINHIKKIYRYLCLNYEDNLLSTYVDLASGCEEMDDYMETTQPNKWFNKDKIHGIDIGESGFCHLYYDYEEFRTGDWECMEFWKYKDYWAKYKCPKTYWLYMPSGNLINTL